MPQRVPVGAWVATHAPTGTRWGTKPLALLLSLALCLTLLPGAAFAAEDTDDTGGTAAVQSTPQTQTAGSGASTPTGMALTQALLGTWLESEDPYNPNSGKIYKMPSGSYYLAEDIYLVGDDADPNSAWPLLIGNGVNVTLDLNGHVLDLRGKNISISASLTLTDSSPEAEHKFRVEDSGLWVLDESGDKTVAGGVITGGTGVEGGSGTIGRLGGGVCVSSGSFTMEGGSIVGCTANSGGGVGVSSGSFTMKGGRITGCTAVKSGNSYGSGGGVCVSSGSFTMEGGSITDCTAADAGGVCVSSGSFTMEDGSITDCTANSGGGVDVGVASFTMKSGAIISGCTANYGGGVNVSSGSFTMEGGSITACTANNGGGIYVQPNSMCELTMKGGSIEGCTAAYAGGGVYLSSSGSESGSFTMEGGRITDCKAGDAPNAVHADGSFTDKSSTIDKSHVSGIQAGHTGSETDPILIGSAEGLKNFRDKVNNGQTGLCATLVCDIVLNDGTFDADGTYTGANGSTSAEQWTPIGDSSNLYAGTFDGGGHTIKGLYVDGEQIAGLFGEIGNSSGAVIWDVTVDGYVKGTSVAGGIVGMASNSATSIQNCANRCYVVAEGGGIGSGCAGGIVGSFSGGSISGCYNTGAVSGIYYVGGIAGSAAGGSISSCYNTGAVSGTTDVGGVAGYASASTVSSCYNTGTVSGTTDVGGVAGYASASTVSSCYNTGTVSGTTNVGGVAGWFTGNTGGSGSISSCYNTGAVSGTTNVGGVVGCVLAAQGTEASVSDCYNTGKVEGTNQVGGVVGTVEADEGAKASVTSCYYLTGTAEKAVGENENETGTVTNVDARTKTEFADGTVRKLLKQNGTANAWKDTCGYLAAAGMTLPLLSWQTADAHDHDGNWSSNEVKHWKECSCGKLIEDAHSGGTATCTVAAVCEVCGGTYGSINEANHSDLQHVPAVAATTTDEGNIEYWYCTGCCKYYKNAAATDEITQEDTVTAKLPGSSGSSGSSPSYAASVEKAEHGSVTISPKSAKRGSTVTVTVTPDRGYTLETLTVADKDGNELKLTDKGSGKYTFTMPSSKVTVTATFMDDNTMLNFFVDVKASDYFYDAVLWAAQNGITSGTDDTHFSPNNACTRAQIVTFLWRAAGSPVVNYAMNMTDVSEDAYYAEAVRWALSEGITTGTSESTFSPNSECTRAQAVAFLFRYAAPEAVTSQELVSGFSDAASVPGYALPAMNWALADGIVQGDGRNLMPNDSCTRAQIVTFLYRALEK